MFQTPGCFADIFFIHFGQNIALKVEPFVNFEYAMYRHNPVRLDPEIGISVAVRHGLPGNFKDVAGIS